MLFKVIEKPRPGYEGHSHNGELWSLSFAPELRRTIAHLTTRLYETEACHFDGFIRTGMIPSEFKTDKGWYTVNINKPSLQLLEAELVRLAAKQKPFTVSIKRKKTQGG